MNMRQFALAGLVSLMSAASLLAPLKAAAQYPERPVTIVVANPPGGLTDIAGRLAAEALREATGKSFVVENKPGASSVIGFEFVAKSAPDGYTILLNSDTQAYMPAFSTKLNFDPVNDFDPITMLIDLPVVVVAARRLEIKSLTDLISQIKAAPGKFNYASGGTGTINHVAGVMFEELTGTKMVHIPYQGGGPAMRDVLGGNVEMVFPTPGVVAPHVGKNTVHILAVTADKRVKELPDVPTTAEAGLPGLVISTYAALSVPKGTPRDIVTKLNRDLLSMLAKPAWREKFERVGTVLGTTPEDARKRIVEEARVKSGLIRRAGIQL